MARPIWRRSFIQLIRFALSLARASAGKSSPARIAIIAITTSNSMRVKADDLVSADLMRLYALSHGTSDADTRKNFSDPLGAFVVAIEASRALWPALPPSVYGPATVAELRTL